jgi:hypothetical protein
MVWVSKIWAIVVLVIPPAIWFAALQRCLDTVDDFDRSTLGRAEKGEAVLISIISLVGKHTLVPLD